MAKIWVTTASSFCEGVKDILASGTWAKGIHKVLRMGKPADVNISGYLRVVADALAVIPGVFVRRRGPCISESRGFIETLHAFGYSS